MLCPGLGGATFLDLNAAVVGLCQASNSTGGKHAKRRMPALPVVEDLEVLEDRVGELNPSLWLHSHNWTETRTPTEAEFADLLARENLDGNYYFGVPDNGLASAYRPTNNGHSLCVSRAKVGMDISWQ